jgi:hypothetical protein
MVCIELAGCSSPFDLTQGNENERRKENELAHLERPFVVTDKNGQPLALFAAASIQEPSKGDADHPSFEYNTFNICFLLKK